MLTADTITDEQICKLWTTLTTHESAGVPIHGVKDCIVALALDERSTGPDRMEARARCAEILNARAKATP